jgi:hypothetical protein
LYLRLLDMSFRGRVFFQLCDPLVTTNGPWLQIVVWLRLNYHRSIQERVLAADHTCISLKQAEVNSEPEEAIKKLIQGKFHVIRNLNEK